MQRSILSPHHGRRCRAADACALARAARGVAGPRMSVCPTRSELLSRSVHHPSTAGPAMQQRTWRSRYLFRKFWSRRSDLNRGPGEAMRQKAVDDASETSTAMAAGTPQGGVISPLLSNIFLHVLDTVWTRRYSHLGLLVRYADDFVVMCDTKASCEQAEQRVRAVFARLGLELHPDKMRQVDLSHGREGFDFLGCHLRKRMSGPLWEKRHQRVYYLQRWPSPRAMQRIRQRVKALTPRAGCHRDLRDTIAQLNLVLRGWGGCFRTGNAARKFGDVDDYVNWRLKRVLIKRHGRQLHAGQPAQWTGDFFHALGLHRLRGTIRYPEAA